MFQIFNFYLIMFILFRASKKLVFLYIRHWLTIAEKLNLHGLISLNLRKNVWKNSAGELFYILIQLSDFSHAYDSGDAWSVNLHHNCCFS